MTSVDELAALEHLRDDGGISDEEYEDRKDRLLVFAGVPTGGLEEEETVDPPPSGQSGEPGAPWSDMWPPTMRTDLPSAYFLALPLIAGLLVLASALGVVSPLVSFLALLALTATLVEGGRWVTNAAGVGLVVIIAIGLLGGEDRSSLTSAGSDNASTAPTPDPAQPGSLGVRLGDLTDLWNSVAEAPDISRGLTLNSEPGQYDSFIYRFGSWGRLAGAYDPSNDSLYALLATGQYRQEATEQLYLHLCFVVHPYSQECIDSYFEKGLARGTLDDFIDTTHTAEWLLDGLTWRLEIESNVLTIRVLSPEVD